MKKFSDMNIKVESDRKMFDCEKVQISDIVNCEVEVLDFVGGVKTAHGEDRYIVHIKVDGKEKKLFTNASNIKSALEQIPKEDFPFTTTIKSVSMGKHKIYQFT
jgi:hypothetical protein